MKSESKYKALNSFRKDLVWIFRAKVCDKMNWLLWTRERKKCGKSLLFPWIWYVVKDYFWSVKSINSKI